MIADAELWDIVQIDWFDSMHTTGWVKWDHVDWANESNSLKHKSVGYLAHQNEESVSILQSLQNTWDEGHPKNIDAVMTIPRCAITRMRVLARKTNR